MADNNDRVYADNSEYLIGEGTLVEDAKKIGDKGTVAIRVAANYKKYTGEEGANFRSILVRRPWSAAVENFKKGDRVTYSGKVEGDNWEDKEGNKRHSEKIIADTIGLSQKFTGYKNKKSNSSSSSSDNTPPFDVDDSSSNSSSSSNDDGPLDLDSLI